MAVALVWTEAQDATIRSMRADGAAWDAICRAIGVSRSVTIIRAKELGVWDGAERIREQVRTRQEKAEAVVDPLIAARKEAGKAALPPCHPIALAVLGLRS